MQPAELPGLPHPAIKPLKDAAAPRHPAREQMAPLPDDEFDRREREIDRLRANRLKNMRALRLVVKRDGTRSVDGLPLSDTAGRLRMSSHEDVAKAKQLLSRHEQELRKLDRTSGNLLRRFY